MKKKSNDLVFSFSAAKMFVQRKYSLALISLCAVHVLLYSNTETLQE